MSDVHEKMVKLRAKGAKSSLKRTRVQKLNTDGKEVGSEGSSSSFDISPVSPGGPVKKQKTPIASKVRSEVKEPDSLETFLLPPCTLHCGLFTRKNSLLLHKAEAEHILARDRET